jgi:hypothetical protein
LSLLDLELQFLLARLIGSHLLRMESIRARYSATYVQAYVPLASLLSTWWHVVEMNAVLFSTLFFFGWGRQ